MRVCWSTSSLKVAGVWRKSRKLSRPSSDASFIYRSKVEHNRVWNTGNGDERRGPRIEVNQTNNIQPCTVFGPLAIISYSRWGDSGLGETTQRGKWDETGFRNWRVLRVITHGFIYSMSQDWEHKLSEAWPWCFQIRQNNISSHRPVKNALRFYSWDNVTTAVSDINNRKPGTRAVFGRRRSERVWAWRSSATNSIPQSRKHLKSEGTRNLMFTYGSGAFFIWEVYF